MNPQTKQILIIIGIALAVLVLLPLIFGLIALAFKLLAFAVIVAAIYGAYRYFSGRH